MGSGGGLKTVRGGASEGISLKKKKGEGVKRLRHAECVCVCGGGGTTSFWVVSA